MAFSTSLGTSKWQVLFVLVVVGWVLLLPCFFSLLSSSSGDLYTNTRHYGSQSEQDVG